MATKKNNPKVGPRPGTTTRTFGSLGPVLAGFDAYGYPIVRNARLPESYHILDGRIYGQGTQITAMKLVDLPAMGEPTPTPPSMTKVDGFKLKPGPNVPAATGLPEGHTYCIQKGESGYFYRFADPKSPLHGSEADVVACVGDVCSVRIPGDSALHEALLCSDLGNDKEPIGPDCCVRVVAGGSGQIVCPGSAYDLMLVKIVTFENVKGLKVASIEHPDLPGGGSRLPVCEPIDATPSDRICCIEESTGTIVCPDGVDFPLNGMRIPLEYLEFVDMPNGDRVARLRCGDIDNISPSERAENKVLDAMFNVCEDLGGYIFPLCSRRGPRPTPGDIRPSDIPAPKFPDICCYDPSTGTLVCEGTAYHGLVVNVVTEAVIGGKQIVSVESESLPGGGMRVPVCAPRPEIPMLPPGKCCAVESSAGLTLICDPSTHPWNGKDVTGMGECVDTNAGRMCVIKFEDAYGSSVLEIPVCAPKDDEILPPGPEDPPRSPDEPLIPPTEPPADGDGCEERGCRDRWEKMVRAPARLSKCDQKWLDLLEKLKYGAAIPNPGHRYSGIRRDRRYSGGVPECRGGRLPGLRGRQGLVG